MRDLAFGAVAFSIVAASACGGSGEDVGAPKRYGGGSANAGTAGAAGNGAKGGSSQGARGGKGGTSTTGGTSTRGGSGGSSARGGSGGSGVGGSGGSGADHQGGGTSEGGTNAGEPGLGGDAGMVGATGGTLSGGGTGGGAGTVSTAGSGNLGNLGGEGGAGEQTVTFTVHTAQDAHPISPLIYGVNPGEITCADPNARFTLCRGGDTRWSTYNWETNASNEGDLLCNQNDGSLGGGDAPAGAVMDLVTQADDAGAAALVTVPLLDYVAADKVGGTPSPDCSGDVSKSGAGYLDTRFELNTPRKGAALSTTPDTTDGAVYQDEFLAFLHDAAGDKNLLFALDNQPGLWGYTNVVVHPDKATYDEVVTRNVTYSKVIRDAWPSAAISGFVGWGYLDYTSLQDSPDWESEGPFIDYYLTAMAQASQTDGRRLIDYFDVHWYPELAFGAVKGNDATPAVAAARVQAPRSLWDPAYVEPDSWVASTNGGQPLRVIPFLKERIAAHYPGTKVAISEWSFGGGTDISGAIATADALGIFGQQDVGLAAWASVKHDDPFVVGAFRMFRNYDGAGATFGDTSVAATSSNVELASIYASTFASDTSRVVLVAINRSTSSVDATLTVDSTTTFTTATTYVLTAASTTPSTGPTLTSTAANTFPYAMPGYSVSVIVPAP